MKIRLSEDAEEQAEVCDTWWREHRKDTPNLFAHELAATKNQLSSTPKIGVALADLRTDLSATATRGPKQRRIHAA